MTNAQRPTGAEQNPPRRSRAPAGSRPEDVAGAAEAVGAEIPTPPTYVRHLVTAWLAAAAVLAYLCRNSLAVAEQDLRGQWGISEAEMGFILGPAFFWTYALAQIPTAWLGERFGSRRCLPVFMAAAALATAAIGLASGFGMLLASRVASGIAQAGIFPCAARTIAIWHPPAGRAFASGLLGAAMSVGGAIGTGLTGWLMGFSPAQYVLAAFAVPGFVWAGLFASWFRERPGEHPQVNAAEAAAISGPAGDAEPNRPLSAGAVWSRLVASPAAWLICGQQFFRAAGYAFFASWFATYLRETRGVTTAQSGWLAALPLAATVMGSTFGGYASDAVFRATGSLALARKGVAVTSLSVCTTLVVAACFVTDATSAVLVISLGAFAAAIAGPCAYTVTMDMGGSHVGSLFSTMNMIGNFGAGLMPWLVPRFRPWVEQQPLLSAWCGDNSWQAVLPLFALCYACAAACWCLLRARGTVFDRPPPHSGSTTSQTNPQENARE